MRIPTVVRFTIIIITIDIRRRVDTSLVVICSQNLKSINSACFENDYRDDGDGGRNIIIMSYRC